jgi:two-component system CheB/CheR fusion protein
VSDSGVGIDPALLPRIFSAFEQGGSDVTRQFGGLGLGLTISKALVELHGGMLDAHSEGKGRGSTFTLAIPTIIAVSQDAEAQPVGVGGNGKPIDGNGRRILLVEDHLDTSRAMCRLLRSFGYDVTPVHNVADAEKAAAETAFDLLISDLGLPDNTGHELVRRLRGRGGRGAAMKAIAVSGYGMDDDKRRSLDSGFVEHLTKPIDIDQLRAAVGRVIGSN